MIAAAKQQPTKYTYQEYLTWPDRPRSELIAGEVYAMVPAPTTSHQRIASKLLRLLADTVERAGCEVFIAPVDVVFDEYNVAQPDLVVICDQSKVTERAIIGPPNLIVEILSPSTKVLDRREKRRLYEHFGVVEYLIIDPIEEFAERYVLTGGRYADPDLFTSDETLTLHTVAIDISLGEVFGRPPAPPDPAANE